MDSELITDKSKMKIVTLVIPTLGIRIAFLDSLFESCSKVEDLVKIFVVCPSNREQQVRETIARHLTDFTIIKEIGSNLPMALNQVLPLIKTRYWNWIGDDDSLNSINYRKYIKYVQKAPEFDLFHAGCAYIDSKNRVIGINSPTNIAEVLVHIGPNLFPQPSLLFSTSSTKAVGGINALRRFAFDQDLILKILISGKSIKFNQVVANYRWHQETLTTRNRLDSIFESFQVRREFTRNTFEKLANYCLFIPTLVLLLVFTFYFYLRTNQIDEK